MQGLCPLDGKILLLACALGFLVAYGGFIRATPFKPAKAGGVARIAFPELAAFLTDGLGALGAAFA
jgi:hypothetical protein